MASQALHDKCWYSEAKDCFSHWHVEHYRPKKTAKDEDGTEYEGYWWLAFDWTNLRICGSAGNPKKGTYFPLRAGCGRCPPHGDIRLEDPQLLDPADVRDPSLLTFNVLGEALAAPGLDDEWDQARVGYSVDRCNLNFPALMGKRKVVWADCWHGIRTYLAELRRCAEDPANAVARGACKAAARGILAMMRPEAELSAVARACVLSSGNQQVQRLLQSA